MKQAQIFIVDNHPITIQGLAYVIKNQNNWSVCGTTTDPSKVFNYLQSLQPHLVIVDIIFKTSCGLQLVKNIRREFPEILILVYSMHDEFIFAELALQSGANGYLCKNEQQECLLSAIQKILDGKVYLNETMQEQFFAKHLQGRNKVQNVSVINLLSDRELYVLRLLGSGLTTKQISKSLNVSSSTVDSYKTNIKNKLKLQNINQLICYAAKWTSFQKVHK